MENLPTYFHGINSMNDAQCWLKEMRSSSRLFIVKDSDNNTIIGYIFVSKENETDAHIGYLLEEQSWGKGYATEILKGLIDFLNQENRIKRLIAGVDSNNIVSCKLLIKLGFVIDSTNDGTIFYKYNL